MLEERKADCILVAHTALHLYRMELSRPDWAPKTRRYERDNRAIVAEIPPVSINTHWTGAGDNYRNDLRLVLSQQGPAENADRSAYRRLHISKPPSGTATLQTSKMCGIQ